MTAAQNDGVPELASGVGTHAVPSKAFLYCHLLLKQKKIYEKVENTLIGQDAAQRAAREKHVLLPS